MEDKSLTDIKAEQAARRIADMIVELINICGDLLHTALVTEEKRG